MLYFIQPMSLHREDSCTTRFTDVFFIDASTEQTIRTDLKNIALSKSIGDSADDTIMWLAGRREDWLLLFDNADDHTLRLGAFFPRCSHGNILITTRNHETCIYAPDFSYNVASMTPEDARSLLLTITKPSTTDEAFILAEHIVKVSSRQSMIAYRPSETFDHNIGTQLSGPCCGASRRIYPEIWQFEQLPRTLQKAPGEAPAGARETKAGRL